MGHKRKMPYTAAMKITLFKSLPDVTPLPLPVYGAQVPAGFPSPADDYIEGWLDLNEYLIKHPAATFFARAAGTSMINAGILDKALLVVDRALQPQNGDVVIASVNGELTCKTLDTRAQVLRAANPGYAPIPIHENIDCVVLGVVTHVVNKLCTHS
jgi:DNA polymerase V